MICITVVDSLSNTVAMKTNTVLVSDTKVSDFFDTNHGSMKDIVDDLFGFMVASKGQRCCEAINPQIHWNWEQEDTGKWAPHYLKDLLIKFGHLLRNVIVWA